MITVNIDNLCFQHGITAVPPEHQVPKLEQVRTQEHAGLSNWRRILAAGMFAALNDATHTVLWGSVETSSHRSIAEALAKAGILCSAVLLSMSL
jgi:hypothetical protein